MEQTIDEKVGDVASVGLEVALDESNEATPRRERSRFERFVERSTMIFCEVEEYTTSMPKLLYRLLKEPEVPISSKVQIAAALAYIAVPTDVIPDFIPYGGWLDDFLVASRAIAGAVNRIGKETVLKYWDGPKASFDKICGLSKRGYDVGTAICPSFETGAVNKIGNRLYHAAGFYARKIPGFR